MKYSILINFGQPFPCQWCNPGVSKYVSNSDKKCYHCQENGKKININDK